MWFVRDRCPCSRSALDSRCAGSPSPRSPCAESRSRRSSSTSRAADNIAAPMTTVSAARAVRTALIPPGRLNTSTASPPAAGSRHSEAGGFVAVVGVLGARPRREEQQVAVGGECRRRLSVGAAGEPVRGAFAGRVEFPDGGDVLGPFVVERGHRGHHPRAVRRDGEAGNPRQRQVVVEVVECGRGHESLVTQRDRRASTP